MTENSPTINRRRFVQATVASAAVLGSVSSANAQSGTTHQYSLSQDGKCIPITPLTMKGLPAKQFYDYRNPDTSPSSYKYASFGTKSLQRKDTSILFLYKGPQKLNLIAVHGDINGGDGGAVTFRMSGLPVHGKFIVKDDKYPAKTNHDVWEYSKHRNWKGKESATANVSWAYQKNRADGMVYGGLGKNFSITINPQFNQQAELSGLSNDNTAYQGEIKQWEVLSGDVNDPTRTKLNMNKPVTISSKPCKSQKTTKQTTTNNTGSSSTTSSQTTTSGSSNTHQGFFGNLVSGFASLIGAVASFFTSLF